MPATGDIAVDDADQAALLFERISKIVEGEPNRTFANDDVRKAARRLSHLLIYRLDGEWPDDE